MPVLARYRALSRGRMVLSGSGQVNSLAKTTGWAIPVANLPERMAVSEAAERRPGRMAWYWRDLLLGRLIPSLFFSLFLARQLVLLGSGFHGVRQASDAFFVVQQLLALSYFTL